MKSKTTAKRKQGFTLIELSIVLVIIGLIVGGVLVGQDLIKAAEIRATISQYEKYNTALNTFRGKYNGLPGDLATAQATAFGIFAETGGSAGTTGHGDANGMIEGGAANAGSPIGETLIFWRHLTDSNLADGSFGVVGNSAIDVSSGKVTGLVSAVQQSAPAARLGPAGNFLVAAISGLNYYFLVPVASITTAPLYTSGSSGMTPLQAYNIDTKLDDGTPNTGIVIAQALNTASLLVGTIVATTMYPSVGTTGAGGINMCTVGTTATYNVSNTYNRDTGNGANTPTCALRFRFN